MTPKEKAIAIIRSFPDDYVPVSILVYEATTSNIGVAQVVPNEEFCNAVFNVAHSQFSMGMYETKRRTAETEQQIFLKQN